MFLNIWFKLNSCHLGKNVNNPLWGWKKKSFFTMCGGFDVGVGQHTKQQMSKAQVKTCMLRWFKTF